MVSQDQAVVHGQQHRVRATSTSTQLPDDEQDEAAEKAYQLSGGRRFPVVVINGEVIVGHNPDKFLEHLKGWGG